MKFSRISLLSALILEAALVFAFPETPEIFVQTGHANGVSALAFSPDGSLVVSGGWDRTVRLWDPKSGKEIRSFFGHADGVQDVAFSPDGRFALSCGRDKLIKLWDLTAGKETVTLRGHGEVVWRIAFSPDGSKAVSAGADAALMLWDLSSGRALRTFVGHSGSVDAAAYSPDGRYLLSGGRDGTVKLWDVESGRTVRTLPGHPRGVNSVAFSPDGRFALSGGADAKMRLWDLSSGNEVRVFKDFSKPVSRAVFSPDGRRILSTDGERALTLWDAASGRKISRMDGLAEGGPGAAFSPDGTLALAARNSALLLWDLSTGKELRVMEGLAFGLKTAAISPDGRLLATREPGANAILLRDTASGRGARTLEGHTAGALSFTFSPDGKILASGGADRTVRLWDVASGRELRVLTGHAGDVNKVEFTRDGRFVVSGGGDGSLRLWDASSGRELSAVTGLKGGVDGLALSADGRFALTGSFPRTVRLWDLQAGTEVRAFAEPSGWVHGLAFSPDGLVVATGGSADDRTIRLWDAKTGRLAKSLKGHTGEIRSLAFSPDGTRLLSASMDGTARLWDAGNGKEIGTVSEHRGGVRWAGFSANGSVISSTGEDGSVGLVSASGRERVRLTIFRDGEWILMTPDGFFTASANGAKNLNVRIGSRVYSMDNFFETYFRPDIVKLRADGKATSFPVAADLRKIQPRPPKISLALRMRDGSFKETERTDSAGCLVEAGALTVRVTASDAGGGVEGIRLANNGKIAGENRRGVGIKAAASGFEQYFSVPLSAGENRLSAVAFAADRSESNPARAVVVYAEPEKKRPNMTILAVGIDEYRNGKYRLNYSVEDAKGFLAAILPKAGKLFGEVRVYTLFDREAKRDAFLKKVETIKAGMRPEDVFVFFYAGHGIALSVKSASGEDLDEFFYILSDVTQMSDPLRCAADGISGTELKRILSEIKAGKQVLFLDACNSGALTERFAVRGAADENALAKLSRATGSAVFASTTKEQSAVEYPELGHGVFTYVLIDAFDGKAALANGQLTAASLKAYMDDLIPEVTKRFKGEEQYPTTFLWGQDFPLGLK